jgi:hypothetical protein
MLACVSCCLRRIDGEEAGGGGDGLLSAGFEIDFTAQGTRSLANGPEVLTTTDGDPFTWTVALAPGGTGPVPDAIGVSAGGLQWSKGDQSTSWSSSAPTSGSRMFLPFAQVFALFDSDVTWQYRVDCYGTAFDYSTTAAFVCGIWGDNSAPSNAGNRLAGAGRCFQAGVPVWRPIGGATAPNYTTAPGPTTNVSGFVAACNSVAVHAGTWPGSWAALRCPIMWSVGAVATVNTEADPMMGEQNSIALGFSALGTVVDSNRVTLERMRCLARQVLPYG